MSIDVSRSPEPNIADDDSVLGTSDPRAESGEDKNKAEHAAHSLKAQSGLQASIAKAISTHIALFALRIKNAETKLKKETIKNEQCQKRLTIVENQLRDSNAATGGQTSDNAA